MGTPNPLSSAVDRHLLGESILGRWDKSYRVGISTSRIEFSDHGMNCPYSVRLLNISEICCNLREGAIMNAHGR